MAATSGRRHLIKLPRDSVGRLEKRPVALGAALFGLPRRQPIKLRRQIGTRSALFSRGAPLCACGRCQTRNGAHCCSRVQVLARRPKTKPVERTRGGMRVLPRDDFSLSPPSSSCKLNLNSLFSRDSLQRTEPRRRIECFAFAPETRSAVELAVELGRRVARRGNNVAVWMSFDGGATFG